MTAGIGLTFENSVTANITYIKMLNAFIKLLIVFSLRADIKTGLVFVCKCLQKNTFCLTNLILCKSRLQFILKMIERRVYLLESYL